MPFCKRKLLLLAPVRGMVGAGTLFEFLYCYILIQASWYEYIPVDPLAPAAVYGHF